MKDMSIEQSLLRRRIDACRFACWELHLFLDSHPNNCEAENKYKEHLAMIEKLTKEYEEKFGRLTETSDNTNRWQWVSGPWPWEGDDE